MTVTLGQLISTMFDSYGRSLGDDKLAAVATEVRITEILGQPIRRQHTRAPRKLGRAAGSHSG